MKDYVVSPTYGTILKINEEECVIFIPYGQNHKIFSPISGVVKSVNKKKGKFVKKIYEIEHLKRGKATVLISGKINVEFDVLVGLPFRPNRIRIDKRKGDEVKRGFVIGEIMLGSMSITRFPKGYVYILSDEGNKVIGGKTKLVEIS